MCYDFSKKTVFITGGRGGIGSVIKQRFIQFGAKVIAPNSDEMNLLDRRQIDNYLSRIEDKPDIVVHCAGINKLAGVEKVNYSIIDDVFQVNLFSFIRLINFFIPMMRENKYGRIIGISSLYGLVSKEKRIPYSSSKHALSGLIKSVALEVASDNVLINGVAPGYVMTEMTRQNLSSEEINDIKRQIPTGRFQDASEIADLCLFLCSSMNQSITGQVIPVDGGFLCR